MKTILVIGTLLIGLTCFASGPVLQDRDPVSATVSQTKDLVSPALIPEAVVFYELPFAGTIPELGTPLASAALTGYTADIWHPPVLNSTMWLRSINNKIVFRDWPQLEGNAINCRSDKLMPVSYANLNALYPIAWYDIA